MHYEKKFMKKAYKLAKKVKGFTSPNPSVGAVIVKKGKIISSGSTKKFGGNHAEVEAFKNAGDVDISNAQLYVTLEPCCTYGNTPPCTDLIIEKGIKKVIIGTTDPNPKVNGKGIQILKENGVKVKVGVLEKKIKKLNRDFEKYITKKLPLVIGKYAMTLDGKIATKTGDSKWISNEKSRKYVHKLRSKMDCILIGKQTVLKDNPKLNVRLVDSKRNPVRIVLDALGEIDEKYFVMNDDLKTIFVVNNNVDKKFIALCEQFDKEILINENQSGNSINLKWLMEKLAEKGYYSVLAEGGAKVFGSLIESELLDEIICFVAPKILTGKDISAFSGSGFSNIRQSYRLDVVKTKKFDDDIMIKADINYTNRTKSFSFISSMNKIDEK